MTKKKICQNCRFSRHVEWTEKGIGYYDWGERRPYEQNLDVWLCIRLPPDFKNGWKGTPFPKLGGPKISNQKISGGETDGCLHGYAEVYSTSCGCGEFSQK